jgi:hypothetical protein
LKAAFGERLDNDEAAIFRQLAGNRSIPTSPVSEAWIIAGRRSGKSRIAALVSAFLGTCVDHSNKLSPGEKGYVLTLAPTRQQANVVKNYTQGFLDASPVLRQQIVDDTTEEIRLKGNLIIGTHAASFRTVRGRTLLAAIFEEAAFWRDESSQLPDVEVYRAVLPALASTSGMLIGISSPYRRVGLLHQKYAQSFGKDDPNCLVIKAPTSVLNPTINLDVIERAQRDDPIAAASEWGADFRNDLSQFLDDQLIDEAVDYSRPLELPPRRSAKDCIEYFGFVDPSGGRHDAFTLAIVHREDDRVVIDVIRGRSPPFDPTSVVAEYAALLKDYGITNVKGDNYSASWVQAAFEAEGITYERTEKPKSQLYLECLPIFARNAIRVPEHAKLLRELRLLERRTHRSGKDTVDHGQNGTDDYANAAAGACYLANASDNLAYDCSLDWVGAANEQANDELAAWRRRQYWMQYGQ